METIWKCPLDKRCEWIEEDKLCKCSWFVQLAGKDPQSEKLIDEWRCALSWIPLLLVENAQTNRGQTQALESFRNEVTNNQELFNHIMKGAIKGRLE